MKVMAKGKEENMVEEAEIRSFREDFFAIETAVGRQIIGQKNVVRKVLCAMICGGNVLLEGQPGLGKTKLIKTIGQVLSLAFSRIQFTPDLMPADVTGTDVVVRTEEGTRFSFQKGPIFANLVLADEINRATPKTQSALLEAMEERTVTGGGKTYPLPEPFFVLATQNPLEQEGTYPLPEAQLDRFLLKVMVPFPSEEELKAIVRLTTSGAETAPEPLFDGEKILRMRRIAKEVPVAEAVMDHAMDILLRTHPEQERASEEVKKYVFCGASPRGAQAMLKVARVLALLDGRFHVSYEDIDAIAAEALAHRIFLGFEAFAGGVTARDLIGQIVSEAKV